MKIKVSPIADEVCDGCGNKEGLVCIQIGNRLNFTCSDCQRELRRQLLMLTVR